MVAKNATNFVNNQLVEAVYLTNDWKYGATEKMPVWYI